METWKMYLHPDADTAKAMEIIDVGSEPALNRELDKIIAGPPQHVEIVNPGIGALCLGIGGPVAAVEWRRGSDDSAIYKIFSEVPYDGPEFEFATSGGNYPEPREYLMPVDEAMRIIRYCIRNHDIPPDVKYLNWESVFEKLRQRKSEETDTTVTPS